jgi:hypothetical protein
MDPRVALSAGEALSSKLMDTTTFTNKSRSALVTASIGLAALDVLHVLDHGRQGRSLGGGFALFGLTGTAVIFISLWLVLRKHPLAPALAVPTGYFTALSLLLVHVISRTGVLSDPYSAAHVDALSWASVIAELACGVVVGTLGIVALTARANRDTNAALP